MVWLWICGCVVLLCNPRQVVVVVAKDQWVCWLCCCDGPHGEASGAKPKSVLMAKHRLFLTAKPQVVGLWVLWSPGQSPQRSHISSSPPLCYIENFDGYLGKRGLWIIILVEYIIDFCGRIWVQILEYYGFLFFCSRVWIFWVVVLMCSWSRWTQILIDFIFNFVFPFFIWLKLINYYFLI